MLTNKNKLREYQQAMVDKLREDFKNKKRMTFFMENNFISEKNSIEKLKEFSLKYRARIIIRNYAVIIDGIIEYLNWNNKMAKIKKISDNQYTYNCLCGESILLETEEPLERLVKCFDCLVGVIEDDKGFFDL